MFLFSMTPPERAVTGALDEGSCDSKALWSTGEAGLPEGISGGESTGAPFEAKKKRHVSFSNSLLESRAAFMVQLNHVQGAMQDSRGLTLSRRHDLAVDVKLIQIQGLQRSNFWSNLDIQHAAENGPFIITAMGQTAGSGGNAICGKW